LNSFSWNNKDDTSIKPKISPPDFKVGDSVNTPFGNGMYVDFKDEKCIVQLYDSNRQVKVVKELVRKR
jgi:hypothetical protein